MRDYSERFNGEYLSYKEMVALKEDYANFSLSNTLDPNKSKKDKFPVCSTALHPEFSYPLVAVAELSIEKGYKPLNWLDKNNNVTVNYLISAAQRHLDLVKLGVDINDQETTLDGKPTKNKPFHAAQVAFNMLMLCLQIQKQVEINDRLFKDGRLK